jgi:hypothetical protein
VRYLVALAVLVFTVLAPNLIWLGTSSVRIRNSSEATLESVSYQVCGNSHSLGSLEPHEAKFRLLEACGNGTPVIVLNGNEHCQAYVEGELYHVDATITGPDGVECEYDDPLSNRLIRELVWGHGAIWLGAVPGGCLLCRLPGWPHAGQCVPDGAAPGDGSLLNMRRQLAAHIFGRREAVRATRQGGDRALYENYLAGAAVILALVEIDAEQATIRNEIQARERLRANTWPFDEACKEANKAWHKVTAAV